MDKLGLLKVLCLISLVGALQAAFVWNTKGEVALFISIAVPLDLSRNDVFLSYNFEASYLLPRTWRKKPIIFRNGNGTHHGPHEDGVADFEDYYDEYEDEHHYNHEKPKPPKRKKPRPHNKPPKKKHKHKPKPKPKPKPPHHNQDFFEGFPRQDTEVALGGRRPEQSLLSRTKFYQILSHRFEQHGFGRGDRCLLRLICEANSAQLGNHNGVLGSLIHVMFSPSSSQYEALPQRYYTAELKGEQNDCSGYYEQCKRSLLDVITRPLADYIGNKTALF